MTDATPQTSYSLGTTARETQRLIWQGGILDRVIYHFLEDAGLVAGMSVLDLGSGAGDVALAAASIVGPAGSVLGIDQHDTTLERARARAAEAGLDNVRFITGDLNVYRPDRQFDAIIGRRVLTYLKDPGQTLKDLSPYLNSGGIMAFDEFEADLEAVTVPQAPTMRKLWRWMKEAHIHAGDHMYLGLRLRRMMLDAGLVEPRMQAYATVFTPEQPTAALASLRSLETILLSNDLATREELDFERLESELAEEYEKLDAVGAFYGSIQAWARKP